MNTPRIAIETRVLPTTHHRGTRIKADDGHGHTFVMPWGHGSNDLECHRIVATLLRDKMGWDEFNLVCGHTKRGMIWVLVDKT